MSQQLRLSGPGLWLLALVLAAVWFGPLDHRKLVKPDEGRYAEIAREMALSGDWVTPRLNGIKYFEKPPMQYWLTAAAFAAFGPSEWTARLWTALSGFLVVIITWRAGTRLIGEQAALGAALALASMGYFFGLAHVSTLDMGLTFFTTLALFAFCIAQREGASEREKRNGMLLTWAALAGAMLSKGLVAGVLPGGTIVLYLALTRDWRLLTRLHIGKGLVVFVVLVAPWFVIVSLRNQEFAWFFFIHEHFLRYATPEARRQEPWWYFAALLLIGVLPWLATLFDAMRAAWRRPAPPREGIDLALFLALWCLFIVVFFSISKSKVPTYILPAFPALALLMGRELTAREPRQLAWRFLPALLAALPLLAAGLFSERLASGAASAARYRLYADWIAVAGAVYVAGAAGAFLAARSGRARQAVIGFAGAGLLAAAIVEAGYETLAPTNSSWHLVRAIAHRVQPDTPFYSVMTYDQTLPFYLNRTVTLVAYGDEFEYGLQQEPGRSVARIEDLPARWNVDAAPLALIKPEHLEQLRALGMAMEVIYDDGKRLIVAKPTHTR